MIQILKMKNQKFLMILIAHKIIFKIKIIIKLIMKNNNKIKIYKNNIKIILILFMH